jgi:hypothetical protein
MKTSHVPSKESLPAPEPLPKPFRVWIAFNLLAVGFYLLPLSVPGERMGLLLGLAVFWAGVIAAFWPYRWLRLIPVTVALLSFYPIRTGTTRLLLLCGMTALWIAALIVFRRRRGVPATLTAIAGLIAGLVLLPGRTPNPASLRAEYVRSLQGFQGTAYIWGGENGIGIDCSGLIRCGWIDANLRTGLRTLNPGPVRQAARIWWQDCSAQELGEGYRDRTRFVGTTSALNRADYPGLQAGEIVVTESGAHTMAYLGDRIWIEADPLAGSVITVQAPAAQNPWFEQPMKIMRWREAE